MPIPGMGWVGPGDLPPLGDGEEWFLRRLSRPAPAPDSKQMGLHLSSPSTQVLLSGRGQLKTLPPSSSPQLEATSLASGPPQRVIRHDHFLFRAAVVHGHATPSLLHVKSGRWGDQDYLSAPGPRAVCLKEGTAVSSECMGNLLFHRHSPAAPRQTPRSRCRRVPSLMAETVPTQCDQGCEEESQGTVGVKRKPSTLRGAGKWRPWEVPQGGDAPAEF